MDVVLVEGLYASEVNQGSKVILLTFRAYLVSLQNLSLLILCCKCCVLLFNYQVFFPLELKDSVGLGASKI